MKRVIVSGLFIWVVFFSSTVNASIKMTTYSIEEAQNIAVENSIQPSIDEMNIKAKESAIKEVKYNFNLVDFAQSENEIRRNFINKQISFSQAQLDYEIASKTKDKNITSLKFDVYKACADLLLCKKEIAREKANLSIMQELYKVIISKEKLGLVTKEALHSLEYEVSSKKSDVKKVEDKYMIYNLELKTLMNLPLSEISIDIKDELFATSIPDIDIEEIIFKKVNQDSSLFEYAQIINIKKQVFNYYSKYYFPGDALYDQAKYELDSAKYDYDIAKRDIEVKLRNKYNDFLSEQDTFNLAAKYEELAKNNLNNIKKKYSKGTVAKEDVLKEEQDYYNAVYEKYFAIYKLNNVKTEFEFLAKN